MKNTLLILMLVITSLVRCQITSNIISETEFNDIEINGIKLLDLKNTLGNQNAVESLFGIANNINKDDDPIYGGEIVYIDYYYNGLEFGFSEGELSAFHITNNNSNITIKKNTVTIGSDISVLGNVVLNTQTNGGKSVIYQYCDGCNNFLSLYIDSNNKITKIIYIEQT